MKRTKFEEAVKENNSSAEITLVRKTGAVLGAGAMAILAVGAVGIYAFLGGSGIAKNTSLPVEKKPSSPIVTTTTTASEAEKPQIDSTSVSQVAVTWRKAGIEEYGLVVETVKATKKTLKAADSEKSLLKSEPVETTDTAADEAETVIPEVIEDESSVAESSEEEIKEETDVKSCDSMIMITNDKVNMRKAASLDAEIITIIEAETEIKVTGYTDNWYRIRYNGKTGYCMKRYADEKPEEEEVQTGVISYTDAEFNMLCYVIQGEVGDCSDSSKIAVSNVVINRVLSDSFPGSIEAVLTQPNQFDAVYGYYGGYNVPTESTIDCVRRALAGENYVGGATYYYAPAYCGGSAASWFESLAFCGEIDGQRYFM